jgi:hypothetical protein
MSSCRVQGCNQFERKRGLRGGAVVDGCDFRRVDCESKSDPEQKRVPRVSTQSWQKLQLGLNLREKKKYVPSSLSPSSKPYRFNTPIS